MDTQYWYFINLHLLHIIPFSYSEHFLIVSCLYMFWTLLLTLYMSINVTVVTYLQYFLRIFCVSLSFQWNVVDITTFLAVYQISISISLYVSPKVHLFTLWKSVYWCNLIFLNMLPSFWQFLSRELYDADWFCYFNYAFGVALYFIILLFLSLQILAKWSHFVFH